MEHFYNSFADKGALILIPHIAYRTALYLVPHHQKTTQETTPRTQSKSL